LDFYTWVEQNTGYKLGEKTYEQLYEAEEVIPYDEKRWGVIPEVLRHSGE